MMPIKEATFWFGITVFGTGLFGWMEGGERMPYAIALSILGIAFVVYSVIAHHFPQLPKLPIWIGLMAITWAAVGYDFYDRHHSEKRMSEKEWLDQPLKRIQHQTFANETVFLDGNEYTDVTFDNVLFDYEGTAPMRFIDIHFAPKNAGESVARIQSGSPVVKTSINLFEIVTEASGCHVGLSHRPQ